MEFKIVFSRRKCWTELLVLQILLVFAGHDDVSGDIVDGRIMAVQVTVVVMVEGGGG
ncbi:hypothetical protein HanXRQr2_Chr01g0031411 [Helianthus annuus]|uniref:Uncharacterized protein n=1 Tax=Helianthus annuus TaxID=4232 RepID=A0A251VP87_HELAN|nr:hypothetical protein HanXRQr2_Chr01g0031411 [Helianthus annuus]KAJ0957699.1 hypothetical protein HanPSC8_Chr01g0030671 [Helianthus annuus]